MKRLKTSLLVAGAVTTVGLTGLAGTTIASAATDTSSTTDPMSSLIDKIATKFNLNKDELKTVFEEERSARQAEREQRVTEALDQLVTDGKITSEQRDKLIAKRAEIKADMEANRDSMQDKTAEERRTLMEERRTELETWAEDNGIDTEYLRYLMGGPGMGRHGGPMMGRDGAASDSSESDTTTN